MIVDAGEWKPWPVGEEVVLTTRKLKAKWSIEHQQDFSAMHQLERDLVRQINEETDRIVYQILKKSV